MRVYSNDSVKLHHESCKTFLAMIPDESVDLAFYDPPYNVKKKYKNYNDDLPENEYIDWMQEVIAECTRIAKRGVVVYVGWKLHRTFANLMPDAHPIVVVQKASGSFAGMYFSHSSFLFASANPVIRCKDVWDDIRLPREGYFFREPRYDHPGLTGLALTEKVLNHFSLPGETILDPFTGVGTTAVACVRTNRKFIGCEISREYLKVAVDRLDAEYAQTRMC